MSCDDAVYFSVPEHKKFIYIIIGKDTAVLLAGARYVLFYFLFCFSTVLFILSSRVFPCHCRVDGMLETIKQCLRQLNARQPASCSAKSDDGSVYIHAEHIRNLGCVPCCLSWN